MRFEFNKKTFVLLSIIAANIIYVVFQLTKGDKSDLKKTNTLANNEFKVEPNNVIFEEYELLPIMKDPFLGTTKKTSNTTGIRKAPNKLMTLWPTITYSGLVASNKNTSKIFILSINGKQVLLSKGEEFNEVKIIRGNSQSIEVRFKGEHKKIEF